VIDASHQASIVYVFNYFGITGKVNACGRRRSTMTAVASVVEQGQNIFTKGGCGRHGTVG
jgi:hypothetical protein